MKMNKAPEIWIILMLTVVIAISATGVIGLAQEDVTGNQKKYVIKEISISGNKEITEAKIIKKLGVSVDREVTKADLNDKLQNLKEMGVFKNVNSSLETNNGNVTIQIEVEEYPVVKEIRFNGAKSVPVNKLKDILSQSGIKTGQVYDQNELNDAVKEITKEYESRGYLFVTVGDIEIGETLVIEIVEGKLASTRIEGLKTVPEKVARNLIDIPKGEVIKMRDLQMAYVNLRGSVYFQKVNLSPARGYKQSDIILRWQLTERNLLDEETAGSGITVEGNTVLSDGKVQNLIDPLPIGGKINNYQLLTALKPLYEEYMTSGYIYTDLTLEGVKDGTFQIEVTEGEVNSIKIEGNEWTDEKVITNKLNLSAGDPYKSSAAQNSKRRIQNLGYFDEVNLEPQQTENGLVLDVKIEEKKKLNSLHGGLTWSGGGLAGKFSASIKNLFGLGQDVSLSLNRGFTEDAKFGGSLDWKNVYYPSQFNFTKVSIFRDLETSGGSSISRQGIRGSFGVPFTGNLSLNMGYTAEWVSEEDDQDGSLTNIIDTDLIFDTRQNPQFPTSGSRGVLTIEKAGDFAPGVSFTKFTVGWRQYFQLPKVNLIEDKTQVLGFRSQSGIGFGVPDAYKTYLGGHSTLRGIGSFATTNYSLLNSEYRIQLLENNLYFTTFVDAGLTFDELDNPEFITSTGLEFNLQLFGHFRIGAAWPVKEDFSWMPTIYFGVGPIF